MRIHMRTRATLIETNDTYLTVAEAARLLKVNKSTIWRWIDKGTLPAYRVGQKGVRLKQADLDQALTPARRDAQEGGRAAHTERVVIRPLTAAEQHQGLRALAELTRLRQELAAKYGTSTPASWELLNQSRDERTRDLRRDARP